MTCKGIRYTGKGVAEVVELDVGEPADDQVLIEGLACGVCAWDIHIYKNGAEGPPGHEGVGRVLKLGRAVTRLKEGDWVVGGSLGFAERSVVPASALHVLPQTRRPQDWIIEPVACIVTGLDHCNLKAGDRIAVVGCGFMGLMFVQALSRCLLDRLVAVDIDPRRLEMAKQFGADEIYDSSATDWQKLHDMSFDTVVDCTGAQAGLDLCSKIVKRGGRLNLFGWNHGVASFPGDTWHLNGITVVNSAPGSAVRNPWPVAIRLLDRRLIDLEPLVSHVVSLDKYPDLLALAASREGNYLKGVVQLS